MSHFPDDSPGKRLRAGDASALADLLRECAPRLASELRRRFDLQECDIEDALIAALENLWEHRDSFDPEKAAPEAWYRAITLNAARDLLKSKKARERLARLVDPATLAQWPGTDDSRDSGDTEAPSARSDELVTVVLAIVDELPGVRRYILLADADSRDGKVESCVLAEELGLSASTVRTHRQRGREAVRQRFAERARERDALCSDVQ
jgi:RNA polymerase sigma factor (sigma-70 family)